MRKEIAQKWVEALRSEEYVQGQGSLKAIVDDVGEARHCCLGVLCELALQESAIDLESEVESVYGKTYVAFNGCKGDLPQAVRDWADMSESNPSVPWKDVDDTDVYPTLAELNDDHRLSFAQIADVIDENWGTL